MKLHFLAGFLCGVGLGVVTGLHVIGGVVLGRVPPTLPKCLLVACRGGV